MAEADPDRYLPNLATSLTNLADLHARSGNTAAVDAVHAESQRLRHGPGSSTVVPANRTEG